MENINISTKEAKKLIEKNKDNPNFEIIDVRTEMEFEEGHIENAKLINIYSSDFVKKITKLDKNKTYLVYCRTGARSSYAVNIMANLKFGNVYNLAEGIINW